MPLVVVVTAASATTPAVSSRVPLLDVVVGVPPGSRVSRGLGRRGDSAAASITAAARRGPRIPDEAVVVAAGGAGRIIPTLMVVLVVTAAVR